MDEPHKPGFGDAIDFGPPPKAATPPMSREDREYQLWEGKQRYFERAPEWEKINIAAANNTDRLLNELRPIKWALWVLAVLVAAGVWRIYPDWWPFTFWHP